ncbi:MAG: methyltransferase domain-containing protein [Planctomycetes bacterium]|nr:methyltransferase domain-containing protein [Planctomycetota bacterium]
MVVCADRPPTLREVPSRRPGALGLACRATRELAARFGAQVGRRLHGLRGAWLGLRARRRLRGAARLCLGCGDAPIAAWTNIDLGGGADVRLDLRQPLPVRSGSVELVYSEHVIEHLDRADGVRLLRECRRVLRPDGVLRIATPDLARLVACYRDDWTAQDWVHWRGHEWVDSAAVMLNQCFHGWGHRFLYDEAELARVLRDAGFVEVERCAIGESRDPALRGLETRADSHLVLEARGEQESVR